MTDVSVSLKVLRSIQKDAERYRFLRDDENWGEDAGDEWGALGEVSADEFDKIIDEKIKNKSYEGA